MRFFVWWVNHFYWAIVNLVLIIVNYLFLFNHIIVWDAKFILWVVNCLVIMFKVNFKVIGWVFIVIGTLVMFS